MVMIDGLSSGIYVSAEQSTSTVEVLAAHCSRLENVLPYLEDSLSRCRANVYLFIWMFL
jgi:hypothetical protein